MGSMEQWNPGTGRVPGQGVESSSTGKKKEFSSISFYGQVTLRVKVLSVNKNISENSYLSWWCLYKQSCILE